MCFQEAEHVKQERKKALMMIGGLIKCLNKMAKWDCLSITAQGIDQLWQEDDREQEASRQPQLYVGIYPLVTTEDDRAEVTWTLTKTGN